MQVSQESVYSGLGIQCSYHSHPQHCYILLRHYFALKGKEGKKTSSFFSSSKKYFKIENNQDEM